MGKLLINLDNESGIPGEKEKPYAPGGTEKHLFNTIPLTAWNLILSFLTPVNLTTQISLINPFFKNCVRYKNCLPLLSIQKEKITRETIKNILYIFGKRKKVKYGQLFSAGTQPVNVLLGSCINNYEELNINPTDRFHFHRGTQDNNGNSHQNGFILM